MGQDEKCTRFGKLEEKRTLERTCAAATVILKWILEKQSVRMWIEFIWLWSSDGLL
jgi:hypothetical protein